MSQIQLINLTITDLKCIISDVVKVEIQKLPQVDINPSEPNRLYGDKAAAAYLGCQPLTIGKLRISGTIPYYRYGRRYYYIASELDQALKGGGKRFGELRGNRRAK